MPVELTQHRRHGPDEHPCIPAEISFADKRFGEIGVWFFPEADHAMDRCPGLHRTKFHRFAVLDVAVTGARPGRLDSDRDQRPGFFRRRRRRRQRFLECRRIVNNVIRRQHHHRCGMIPRGDPADAKRHRRRRIALGRFRHDVFLRQLRQQFPHRRFLVDIRQDQQALRSHQALEPRDRLLQKRLFRHQPQQLLRPRPPAQRPEAFAASAGQDERVKRVGHDSLGAKRQPARERAGSEIFPFPFPKRDV